MPLSQPELYGLGTPALTEIGGAGLLPQVALAFEAMAIAARNEGIAIAIASGYRSFERQLAIWNAKAGGKRPLLDRNGTAIDPASLDPQQLMEAILLWSALPGTSRHHWGTDLDVFDCNRITKAELQLVPAEYQQTGPCGALHDWLNAHAHEYGFFFPYQAGLSGVSAEPWHLSYAPLAVPMLAKFDSHDLALVLEQAPLALKAQVLPRLDALVRHYVHFIAPPGPAAHPNS
ncbi:M15 family metallopeptidase [Shewanella cyperi]|uniref:M15 family metallopeptidase n=1 Tax=Shewanella cyperi TaxID=2814292 RepID=UPI001D18C63A|nr:M15 family metallopeptidase [Shewanella cyperi]